MAEQAIVIDPRDTVAVAVREFGEGEKCTVRIEEARVSVRVLEPIAFGHKIALRRIPRGTDVIKYGEVIGEATADIEAGAWVHTHNLASKRGKKSTPRRV